MIAELNYDEIISRGCGVEHATVTIVTGLTIPAYTPIAHVPASGHFAPVAAAATSAQYLTAFDIDTTAGAAEHSVIKKITIVPSMVNYPAAMSEQVRSGLFAGTPINVEEQKAF